MIRRTRSSDTRRTRRIETAPFSGIPTRRLKSRKPGEVTLFPRILRSARNAETMARIISNWPGEPFDVEMIYERGKYSEPGSDKGQLFAIPGVAAAARTR